MVVAATSEQPALARIRAAHAAVAIATWFAAQGRSVLLTMDSITRLAMARREVGLAAGEPATARGYTPSAFAELPQLCERCGTFAGGGSVTALFTVLVEGDDLNEPVADHMRAILDGHIVLSRELAQQGHYPAIDVLRSASRVMSRLAGVEERRLAADAVRRLAVLEKNRQLVELGAYVKGANAALDTALAREAALSAWLRQDGAGVDRQEALHTLSRALASGAAPADKGASGTNAAVVKRAPAAVASRTEREAETSRHGKKEKKGAAERAGKHAKTRSRSAKEDPDADLLAALVARTKPYEPNAAGAHAPKGASAGAASAKAAQPSAGAHHASLNARLKACDKGNFFEAQACRWRVCSDHWGKDPACPSTASAAQTH